MFIHQSQFFQLGTRSYTPITVFVFNMFPTSMITEYLNCGSTAIDGFFVFFNRNWWILCLLPTSMITEYLNCGLTTIDGFFVFNIFPTSVITGYFNCSLTTIDGFFAKEVEKCPQQGLGRGWVPPAGLGKVRLGSNKTVIDG